LETIMINEDAVDDVEDDSEVEDESAAEDTVASVRYNITSFGVDFDVEGAVRRLARKDIAIPDFQRSYVWSQAEASRLVESLLLGLPVPGVFLASEPDTKQLLVIDGQQRLRSLQYFYSGEFNPSQGSESVKKFRLIKVQERFEGKTYQDLSDEDRRTLDNSVIHATVVKQESPENDDTGMYHIFERLNTGGKKLVPQEIRVAIYHGELINLLKKMNDLPEWRSVYGPKSSRLKDQELLLRFLAFFTDWSGYTAPMTEFLSKYAKKNRHVGEVRAAELFLFFEKAIKLVHGALGSRAFRIIRALNAAVFDSVMVAVAEKYQSKSDIDQDKFHEAYQLLLQDPTYKSVVSRSTGNEKSVELRIRLARDYFKNV